MFHLSPDNVIPSWDKVYDKYSPMMFGMICKLTSNCSMAEKMLADSFVKLKEDGLLTSSNFNRSPVITILRHTYQCAVRYLGKHGIPVVPCASTKELGILWLVCTKYEDLKTLSNTLGISETDARKKLFTEFGLLNMQKQPVATAA